MHLKHKIVKGRKLKKKCLGHPQGRGHSEFYLFNPLKRLCTSLKCGYVPLD